MLLADFHVHSTWSDGSLSIPEVVDLFGKSGHDVIAHHRSRRQLRLVSSARPRTA